MNPIIELMSETVDALNAAGVRATMNPASVNPPCVLVLPPALEIGTICANDARCEAVIIAAPPAGHDAIVTLYGLLPVVCETIPDIETVEPATYRVDDTGGALPALKLTWQSMVDLTIREEN